MPKRNRAKRNNISLHQRIQAAMEWQKWMEVQNKKKRGGYKKMR